MKRVSPSNIVAVLVALWIGANCAGGCNGPTGPAQVVHVRVNSGHWYAKTVRVVCSSGYELGAVRGIVMGQPASKRVHLTGCQSVRLRVEAIGGEWWMSEDILISPGDTIRLDIGPQLNLSSYFVRDR